MIFVILYNKLSHKWREEGVDCLFFDEMNILCN